MNTTSVIMHETKIPDECFGSKKHWEEYWEELDSAAIQLLNEEYYEKFKKTRERGYLRYARIGLLSATDFLFENSEFDPYTAREIYRLLAFSRSEVELIRQSEYKVGRFVPEDLR